MRKLQQRNSVSQRRPKPSQVRRRIPRQTPRQTGLTERERRFVECYMANGGNASKAAADAGFSASGARVQGHRLLTRANIMAAIDALRMGDPQVMTRADRQAWWTKVVNGEFKGEGAKFSDRTKASELLGRSQADFIEVRIAPIVTDPHASVHSLTERLTTLVHTIKARRQLQTATTADGKGRTGPRLVAARR